ncbi:MAG: WYL domain-containing transcriptional regulator [Spirochaetales bacterium]|nr:WYL domain-containing transcriptional regulator [Spirochaetales bacterium]
MKGDRIMQLELLLLSHPGGMRRAEIARRLGVHRSTVGRYIDVLKKHLDIKEDKYLIKLTAKDNMDMMKLSIYESLAFNISAEMLASHGEFQNPHLASGLRKIAGNMRSYAPNISQNIDAAAEAIETSSIGENIHFTAVFEVLIDAWVSGKIVRLKHSHNSEAEQETEFAPYFIGFREDSQGRKPISVTGRLRHTSEIVTLDIQDIHKAEILDEIYTIPDNLKPFRKPETGERYDGIDMIPLKLRLRERSALNSFNMLYREHIKTYEDDNGQLYCEMQAENSIELLLRLVQCGDAIEIVEPANYRKKFIRELSKILKVY